MKVELPLGNRFMHARDLRRSGGSRRSLVQEIVRHRYLYLLMLPTYLLVCVFTYQPAASALYHAFFWWNGLRTRWVGLSNFVQMVRDPYFFNSVFNSIQLTLFQLIVHLSMALMVATLVFRLRSRRAAYWYRTLLVLPMAVPSVVTFLIWKWFYSYSGFVNIILGTLGHPDSARAWLGEPSVALYALMFVGFPWAGGLPMLIFLAGLQQIPGEAIEAAIVDGVGTWSRFFFIELPLIMGQVKLLVILSIIGGVQQFTLPLVMTQGGPGWSTMVPGLRMYQVVTSEFQYGYASAIGVTLFVVIIGLTYLNQRYLQSGVGYEPPR